MNKLKKYLYSIILIMYMFATISISYATSEQDLITQENNIDKQIEKTNSEISDVKEQMSVALNQINQLNAKISSYESEIDVLESQLSTIITQIAEKEKDIQTQEQKYKEQEETLKKRLVAIYESGSSSYLDMLLSADNLSDFISKYYLISQMAELDQELLQKIENTKKQIQAEKEELDKSKEEVSSSKETIELKRKALNLSVQDKNNLVSTLTDEEKALNEQLEQFERDKKAIQDEMSRTAQKESQNGNVASPIPSLSGYIFPVSGLSKANINNKSYPSYPGHNGVDVNIGVVGKNVVAVKSGTVEKSKALRHPDGSYKSYGEYIMINHHDGTQTLYAHLLSGSRTVSEGEEVAQGQVIGIVGSTGRSTGPHLHFGVYINAKRSFVNPLPYLP